MLITFEPNVAQRSVASQNDHKSKACLPEASNTAFTMYRRLKRRLRRLYEAPFFLAPHSSSSGTSSARNKNLRPLLNTNIPLISGKYGLRNHFWPLESRFLMRKSEEKGSNSKSPLRRILIFWILNLHIIMCQNQEKSTMIHLFCITTCSWY